MFCSGVRNSVAADDRCASDADTTTTGLPTNNLPRFARKIGAIFGCDARVSAPFRFSHLWRARSHWHHNRIVLIICMRVVASTNSTTTTTTFAPSAGTFPLCAECGEFASERLGVPCVVFAHRHTDTRKPAAFGTHYRIHNKSVLACACASSSSTAVYYSARSALRRSDGTRRALARMCTHTYDVRRRTRTHSQRSSRNASSFECVR